MHAIYYNKEGKQKTTCIFLKCIYISMMLISTLKSVLASKTFETQQFIQDNTLVKRQQYNEEFL